METAATAGKLVLIHGDTEHDRIVTIDENIVVLQHLGRWCERREMGGTT